MTRDKIRAEPALSVSIKKGETMKRRYFVGVFAMVMAAGLARADQAAATKWETESRYPKHLMASHDGFELWSGGRNNDVLCIKHEGSVLVYDHIADSLFRYAGFGKTAGMPFALVVSGTKGDMATAYGFSKNRRGTWKAKICYFPVANGNLGYRIMDNEAQFIYGARGDRFRKLRWDGKNWYSSMIWDSWGPACNLLVLENPVNDASNAPRIIQART